MKKKMCFLALASASLLLQAQAPTLTVHDLTVSPGEKNATIMVTSDVPLTGFKAFQFDLAIPDFLTPIESYTVNVGKVKVTIDAQNSEIINDHSLAMAYQPYGAYRFLCYSTSESTFVDSRTSDNDYQNIVLTLDVDVDSDAPMGTSPLSILTTAPEGSSSFALKLVKPDESYVQPKVVNGTCNVVGTYLLNVSNAGYATWMTPFAADVPEGLTAYECSEIDDNVLVLSEASSIEANVPYIIAGTPGNYSFTGTPIGTEKSYSKGLLTGIYEDTNVNSGYVLQNNNNVVGFYRINPSVPMKVLANHCYLNYSSEKAPMLRLGGYTNIGNTIIEQNDGAIYDLSGKEVLSTKESGIYIINNQKVIIKK